MSTPTQLEELATTIAKNKAGVIFYLGAGVSVQSGIPTFRGLNGMYTLPIRFAIKWILGTAVATFLGFLLNVSLAVIIAVTGIIVGIGLVALSARLTYKMIMGYEWSDHSNKLWVILRWWIYKYVAFDPCISALPSHSHCAIKRLQDSLGARDLPVIVHTTNVDGLEDRANIFHVSCTHGRIDRFLCTKCKTPITLKKMPWTPVKCNRCKTPLRTACVLFREHFGIENHCEDDFCADDHRHDLEISKPKRMSGMLKIVIGCSGAILGPTTPHDPWLEINPTRAFKHSQNYVASKSEDFLPLLIDRVLEKLPSVDWDK